MTKHLLVAGVLLLTFASPRAAQQPARKAPTPAGDPKVAEELIALEQTIEASIMKADVPFLTKLTAEDFRFQHGDGWIASFDPPGAGLETKPMWLKTLRPGRFTKRILDNVKVEQHGDIAVTSGRIQTATDGKDPKTRAYTVNYVRVFARRNGQWQWLMHRTVRYVSNPEPGS